MVDREPIVIDVDEIVRRKAGQIVIDALVEAGLNPKVAHEIPMVRSMVGMWGRKEMTREEFIETCGKIAILNPRAALVRA